MRHSVLATASLITVLGLLASGSASAWSQAPAATPKVDPRILAFLKPVEIPAGDTELQKKLKERHNVAVKLLEERVEDYKKGVRDANAVFEAARLTGEAKLDLVDSKEARVPVLEQILDIAKLIENHLQEQLKKGFGSKSDFERTRLARLTVEVELLRAKDKNGTKP